jgi:hypothetical protein
VQYLAAEYQLAWQDISEAQSRLHSLAKLFTGSPNVQARLLLGGGHNYEFTKNSGQLHQLRLDFIPKMVRSKLGGIRSQKQY